MSQEQIEAKVSELVQNLIDVGEISPNVIRAAFHSFLQETRASDVAKLESLLWAHEGGIGAAPTYRKMHNDVIRECVAALQAKD